MRIGETHLQVKGLVADVGKEFSRHRCHLWNIAWTTGYFLHVVSPRIHTLWLYVQLANDTRGVLRVAQLSWNRRHRRRCVEVVDRVRVTILTVGMAVVARENVGATCSTRRRRAVGVGEACGAMRQGVDLRRLDDTAAIAAGERTPVIGDQEQDILARFAHGVFQWSSRYGGLSQNTRHERRVPPGQYLTSWWRST
jgi:hypothetical protein